MTTLAFYLFSAATLGAGALVIAARNPVHSVFFLILSFFSSAGLFVLLGAELLAMILVVVYVGAVAVLFLFVVMMLDIPKPKIKRWFVPQVKATMQTMTALGVHLVIFFAALLLLSGVFEFLLESITSLNLFTFAPWNYEGLVSGRVFISEINSLAPFEAGVSAALMVASFSIARGFGIFLTHQKCSTLFQKAFDVFPVGLLGTGLLVSEILVVSGMWAPSVVAEELTIAPTPPSSVLPNSHAIGQLVFTDYIYVFQAAGMVLLVAMIGAIVLTHRKREGVRRQEAYKQISRKRSDAVEFKKVGLGEGVSS